MQTLAQRWFADCEADCREIQRISFVRHGATWAICTWDTPAKKPSALTQIACGVLLGAFTALLLLGFLVCAIVSAIANAVCGIWRVVRSLC